MGVHPVRAFLAVLAWGATVYFLAVGIEIPGAWWAIVGVVSTHYFEGLKRESG